MKLMLLFTLRARHGGDPARPCTRVKIVPARTELGQRAIERHHLLARPVEDGLRVFGPVDERDRPHVDFEKLTLQFEVTATDPSLAHHSDLEGVRKLARPVFRRPRSGEVLRLREGQTPLPPGVLAAIEIGGVSADWLRRPRTFILDLPHRDLLWVYYVVSRRAGQVPRVVDADSARNLQFQVEALDAGSAGRDPVAAAILRRHPDRALFRLVAEPPAGARSLRGLSLRSGDQTLLAELPAPPLHHHMSLVSSESKPRDAIYRVLET